MQFWTFRSMEYLKGTRIIEVSLSDKILPYLIDIQNNFASFDLAVNQINEYTELYISYELEKRGKIFHHLHYQVPGFSRNDSLRLGSGGGHAGRVSPAPNGEY